MFPSYRNQSVDLQSKWTDWFLDDGKLVFKGLMYANNMKGPKRIFEVLQVLWDP